MLTKQSEGGSHGETDGPSGHPAMSTHSSHPQPRLHHGQQASCRAWSPQICACHLFLPPARGQQKTHRHVSGMPISDWCHSTFQGRMCIRCPVVPPERSCGGTGMCGKRRTGGGLWGGGLHSSLQGQAALGQASNQGAQAPHMAQDMSVPLNFILREHLAR